MDARSLLIKAITLLYSENVLKDTDKSVDFVKEALILVKTPETSLTLIDNDKNIIEGLKRIVVDMLTSTDSVIFNETDITQRMQITCGEETHLVEAFQAAVVGTDDSKLRDNVIACRGYIKRVKEMAEVADILTKTANAFKYGGQQVDATPATLKALLGRLEPYAYAGNNADPAIIDSIISSSNVEDRVEVFAKAADMLTGTNFLNLGLIALNNMFGGSGGRRGETVVFSALPNNFKTTMMLYLTWWIVRFNVPVTINPTKKPLIYRASTEDDLHKNVEALYGIIYFEMEGKLSDIQMRYPLPAGYKQASDEERKAMDKERSIAIAKEMEEYITRHMTSNGWTYCMERVDPQKWTPKDLTNRLEKLENEGYEIVACVFDYFGMLQPLHRSNNKSDDIKASYNYIRNWCAIKNIFLATAHQISNKAKDLIRTQTADFVKMLPGGGYYDACGRLDAEVDAEVHLHLEVQNGQKWLTVARGKHRRTKPTPLRYLYFAIPISETEPLRADFGGQDRSCVKVGGQPVGSGQEFPAWEMNDDTLIG